MNNYITPTNKNNFFDLSWQCFGDAKTNIRKAVDFNSTHPLKNRVKYLLVGIALAIPVVNVLAYIALKRFCSTPTNASQKLLEDTKNHPVDSENHKKKKSITFGQVRGRFFDQEEPPEDIINQNSVILGENGEINKKDILKRKYPPLTMYDTIVSGSKSPKSVHGEIEIFADEDILTVHKIVKKEKLTEKSSGTFGNGIEIEYSENGKAIIQQQGARGCAAASTAMLIADHKKSINVHRLVSCNFSPADTKITDLEQAGLTPITTTIKNPQMLEKLEKQIKKQGSALVTISDEETSHAIVVDAVNLQEKSVRLRDPYHGWEITVKAASFLARFHGGMIIQVQNG